MSPQIPGTFPPRPELQPAGTSSGHVGGIRSNSSAILAEYSHSMGKLNDINNMLDVIGVERVLEHLEIPRIVTIGNQGSGKSSLIERIAKISLPRAKGTTTRCPMEIIMKTKANEGPKYTVSLNIKFRPDGTAMLHIETREFDSTENPEELALIIKRAQLAILNPKEKDEKFLALDEAQCEAYQSELFFSKNVVVLKVTGAESDLTLYDLPGIISHVEDTKDRRYIQMARELAFEYTKPDKSLILVTVSMAEELNTQPALEIAQECDPTESRTIVVLTKVDRVQESERKYWLDRLKKDEKIGKYFLTILIRLKQWKDEQDELTVLSNAPWSAIKASQKGTKNVIKTISKRLADNIQKMLPTAWDLIENEISVNKEELFSLPQSFSDNPQQRVFGLCDDFTKRVTECTIGKGHSDNIIDSYLCDKYKELRDRILATCPQFEVPESRRTQSPLLTPSSSTPTTLSLDESKSDTADTLEHPPGQEVIPLQKVREVIKANSKRQLPGEIDTTALVPEFTTQLVSTWQKLCQETFRAVHHELKRRMDDLCEQYFRRFTALLGDVKKNVRALMQDTADETRKQIDLICRFERGRPITQNSETFLSSKGEHITNFLFDRAQFQGHNLRASFMIQDPVTRRHRYLSQEQLSQNAVLNHTMSELMAQGIPITNPKQLARLRPRDEYETEIHLISAVLAYFEIASMRVIEVMPMIFEVVYLQGFEEGLRKKLTVELKLMDRSEGQKICKRYARENEETQENRRMLIEKQRVLMEAKNVLLLV